jgi:hypothetical protein
VTETTDREELLRKIVDLELRMFLAVQPSIPSACQEMPDTFKLMRTASFLVLSDGTLRCYLSDLEEAMDEGQNLMELKYARIDDMIPRLNDSPTIARIVEVEGRWMDELAERYPLTFRGRSDYAAGVYLRSELETYSAKTLDSYFRDVTEAMGAGRNLTEERYAFMFKESGYDSIDDVETERKQAQQA